jgi:transcriptional regulator with XRE-family HTH domain
VAALLRAKPWARWRDPSGARPLNRGGGGLKTAVHKDAQAWQPDSAATTLTCNNTGGQAARGPDGSSPTFIGRTEGGAWLGMTRHRSRALRLFYRESERSPRRGDQMDEVELIVHAETEPGIPDPSDGFGKRLEAARRRCGFSRVELARRLGVCMPTIWQWETKGRRPRRQVVPALTRALGIEERQLYGDNGDSTGKTPATISAILEEARKRIARVTGLTPNEIQLEVKLIARRPKR